MDRTCTHTLNIGVIAIHEVSSTESLCVLLDNKFNWKTHIHYVSCKLSIDISLISKAKWLSNDDSLVTLYYSCVHSYMCYRNHVGEAHWVKLIKANYSTKTNLSNYFWNDTDRTLRPNVSGIGFHQVNWFKRIHSWGNRVLLQFQKRSNMLSMNISSQLYIFRIHETLLFCMLHSFNVLSIFFISFRSPMAVIKCWILVHMRPYSLSFLNALSRMP